MASKWLLCGFNASSDANLSCTLPALFICFRVRVSGFDHGTEALERIQVERSAAITGMEHLAQLPGLESLNLGYTGIGDRGLGALGAATRLTSLDLDSCNVSDRCAHMQRETPPHSAMHAPPSGRR